MDEQDKLLRVSVLTGSLQESDLSEPTNCEGLGRIRHFQRRADGSWSPNPLPIEPAARALGLEPEPTLRAQVFQNAVCNWRCWYCFVDFELLAGSERRSRLVSCDQLLDLYLRQDQPPAVIDLSGGQPDLVPEWPLWMLDALDARGLTEVYVWSDDNLSTDYLFRYLTREERRRLAKHDRYGKVCCFKGFSPGSFSFNTRAEPHHYDVQFDVFTRLLLETEIDLYCYTTLTTPAGSVEREVVDFVDRLQDVHENLPLRTVPLEVQSFAPVEARLARTAEQQAYRSALDAQYEALAVWQREIAQRFSESERHRSIVDVRIRD